MKKRPVKIEARSAREAMEKMLHEKKISSKINYDVLMNLNLGSVAKPVEPPPKMETPTKVEEAVAVKRSKTEPDINTVQVYLCFFVFSLFENCLCLRTGSSPGACKVCQCGVPQGPIQSMHILVPADTSSSVLGNLSCFFLGWGVVGVAA